MKTNKDSKRHESNNSIKINRVNDPVKRIWKPPEVRTKSKLIVTSMNPDWPEADGAEYTQS